MVTQQVRKVGNSFVITVPKSEVERLGLEEGDFVSAQINKLEIKPILDPEIKNNVERNREGLTAVMQYLKDK